MRKQGFRLENMEAIKKNFPTFTGMSYPSLVGDLFHIG